MDSEQSAALAATHRHHKYMTCINPQSQVKKQRYIEVFQCSIDDMNLVLTGGVPVQRPLLSPGMCCERNLSTNNVRRQTKIPLF